MPTALRAPLHLGTDRLRLSITPWLGAGVASLEGRLRGRWIPLLRAGADPGSIADFNQLGAYWLVPWCNRISDGRFTWRGRTVDLGTNWADPSPAGPRRSAIHGVACAREWDVLHQSPDAAACRLRWSPGERTPRELAWPWRFTADVRYTLTGATLRAEIGVTNDDGSAMPLGLGFHPFIWRDPAGGGADVRLRADTRGRMEARWLVPTGRVLDDGLAAGLREGHRLNDAGCDHAFDGFAGLASVHWDHLGASLELRCSDVFRRLHVFTRSPCDEWATEYAERHRFIAVEPVTQGADAFARDEAGVALDGEVIALEPGARVAGTIELRFN